MVKNRGYLCAEEVPGDLRFCHGSSPLRVGQALLYYKLLNG